MTITNKIATLITVAALTAAAAEASDQYVFPSPNGVQLAAAPAPTFAQMPTAIGVGSHVGMPRAEQPLPPPYYAAGPARNEPYAGRMMSHALAIAPYSNYAADYARLFAPNYAVTAWTDRVFGVVQPGYSAVDGWTAATYGLTRLRGGQRGESAPDLTLLPAFKPHPELQAPTFRH